MNIGIVTTWFERGAAYVSKQYEQVLSRQGNSVYIYARSGEHYARGDKNWDQPNVYWSKRYAFPVFNYTDSGELLKWAKDNNIDTVIFNEQYWLPNVLMLKGHGIKVGAYIDYYTQDMLPTFLIYDFLLCNTEKHYIAFKDIHPRALYLPWGTDTALYNTSHLRKASDKVRFFHSAGMSAYRKGTDLAVRAFLKLSPYELEKAVLIIHAQRDPFSLLTGEEKALVEKFIEQGCIQVIEGTISAPGLYHYGDVYVYPSRLDGIGLTIAEAIASGMPVIVPDDKPMNEFFTPDSYKVKIDKLFCRADAYYWPMNEVNIDDLCCGYRFYIERKKILSGYSATALNYARYSLNFDRNMVKLTSLIFDSKPTTYDVNMIVKYSNKRFPFIFQLERLYRFMYKVYKGLK